MPNRAPLQLQRRVCFTVGSEVRKTTTISPRIMIAHFEILVRIRRNLPPPPVLLLRGRIQAVCPPSHLPLPPPPLQHQHRHLRCRHRSLLHPWVKATVLLILPGSDVGRDGKRTRADLVYCCICSGKAKPVFKASDSAKRLLEHTVEFADLV